MEPLTGWDRKNIGRRGEHAAADRLGAILKDVSLVDQDHGSDVVGRLRAPGVYQDIWFKFQIKTTCTEVRTHIRFNFLRDYLTGISDSSVVLLHLGYSVISASTANHLCVLVLHEWLRRDRITYGYRYARHEAFTCVGEDMQALRTILLTEAARIKGNRNGRFSSKKQPLSRPYSEGFLLEVPEVCIVGELTRQTLDKLQRSLGAESTADFTELMARVADRQKAVPDALREFLEKQRRSGLFIGSARSRQQLWQFYQVVQSFYRNEGVLIPPFRGDNVRAWRAFAAMYPIDTLRLSEAIVRKGLSGLSNNMLMATQVLLVLLEYSDEVVRRRAEDLLRQMQELAEHLHVSDLPSYQLHHHMNQAVGEGLGKTRITDKAVECALRTRTEGYELEHLKSYDPRWYFNGPQMYESKVTDPTPRDERTAHYNRGMANVMVNLLVNASQ